MGGQPPPGGGVRPTLGSLQTRPSEAECLRTGPTPTGRPLLQEACQPPHAVRIWIHNAAVRGPQYPWSWGPLPVAGDARPRRRVRFPKRASAVWLPQYLLGQPLAGFPASSTAAPQYHHPVPHGGWPCDASAPRDRRQRASSPCQLEARRSQRPSRPNGPASQRRARALPKMGRGWLEGEAVGRRPECWATDGCPGESISSGRFRSRWGHFPQIVLSVRRSRCGGTRWCDPDWRRWELPPRERGPCRCRTPHRDHCQ